MTETSRTFVSMNGDFPNIGDAIIRRLAYDLVRDPAGAIVYSANAPDMWLEQINVSARDTIIRGRENFWKWGRAVARAPRGSTLLLEPGEVILDIGSARREAGLLALALIVKAKGGKIILPPRAAVRPARITLALHRCLCRLASVALWRDRASFERVGVGDLSPDIAFSAGVRTGVPDHDRDLLVVSMRGHRPAPSSEWIRGVKSFAQHASLRIVTLSQVRSDEQRASDLAKALDGTHLPWASGGDLEHEAHLRRLYDSANVVVSDRLHVLIVSSLSGAVPAEVAHCPAPKVRTHFEQIGFDGASLDSASATADEIVEFLAYQASRRAELREKVAEAEHALRLVRETLRRTASPTATADSR